MTWFVEEYAGWRQGVRVERELAAAQTPFQKVEMLETSDLGRLLVIDGKTQVCELDEFVYHEMLAHPPLLAHPAPRRVMVLGGGDGGTVREVLKHDVEEVRLIEIDPFVVKVCQEWMPAVFPARDPRLTVVNRDAAEEIREARGIDAILVDSSDPEGPSERLFTEAFFRELAQALAPGGVVALQAGSPFLARQQVDSVRAELAKVFRIVRPYLIPVPTYPGGTWTLVAASNEVDVLKRREASFETRYYHPTVSLTLPPFLQ